MICMSIPASGADSSAGTGPFRLCSTRLTFERTALHADSVCGENFATPLARDLALKLLVGRSGATDLYWLGWLEWECVFADLVVAG